MILKQIENFFPNLDHILPEIKKIPLYTKEEYIKVTDDRNNNWPGRRSLAFQIHYPILWHYINNLFLQKNILTTPHEVSTYLHLKLASDGEKDWIHKDASHKLAALIYISETNFDSGTYLYGENKNLINDIKFVKNRLIMYSGNYNHMGYGHHGTDINNGRLTINLFIKDAT